MKLQQGQRVAFFSFSSVYYYLVAIVACIVYKRGRTPKSILMVQMHSMAQFMNPFLICCRYFPGKSH